MPGLISDDDVVTILDKALDLQHAVQDFDARKITPSDLEIASNRFEAWTISFRRQASEGRL